MAIVYGWTLLKVPAMFMADCWGDRITAALRPCIVEGTGISTDLLAVHVHKPYMSKPTQCHVDE